MGRGKLNMELIKKEKARHLVFKKRKEGLIRKMHELTTLCDVSACMIVYGPKQENVPVEPEIWPQNPDQIRGMIDTYKAKKQDFGSKTFGLNDFFQERKRKIENELSKLRIKNREAKYPTELNDEMQNKWSEAQLRQFAAELSNRSEYVKSRINMLKTKQVGVVENNNYVQFGNAGLNGQFYHPPPPSPSFPINYPNTVDHHHPHPIGQNSMMMLPMNGADEFGGASSSGGNFASYGNQDFYETASTFGGWGVVDPMTRYYGLPLPPLEYMEAPPEVHLPIGWDNYGNYQT